MDFASTIGLGLAAAATPENLLYCLFGVVIGTLIGVLPGIGPLATMAMLMPATFALPPLGALVMLAGIFYGSQYGGSTTAILLNIPGEGASVPTALDGYQMARKGLAGVALTTAAVSSFVAGTIGTLALALLSPLFAAIALQFGAAEYFMLMVLGLMAAIAMAHGSVLKAAAMVVLGIALGCVGVDVNSGVYRFTFGQTNLAEGLGVVAVAAGLFGIVEVIRNLEEHTRQTSYGGSLGRLWPNRREVRRALPAALRGSAIGTLLGILPGSGATMAAFTSYTIEKKAARDESEFGRGAIEGVAGPEAANNAAAQTTFIPLLTLGLPGNAIMAIMMGAMLIHGVVPGPNVLVEQPVIFWGLIASMWIGNVILIFLNIPLVRLWVWLITLPYRFLFPAILTFTCIGVYSVNNEPADIALLAAFGAGGWLLVKLEFEPAPLLLGFILGPMMEEYLRRALLLSHGSPDIFVERPISLALLALAVLVVALLSLPVIRRGREQLRD